MLVYSCRCKLILLILTAVSAYSVTQEDFTCEEEGLRDLESEQECKDVIPLIQDVIPNASYVSQQDLSYRPPGCYFLSNVFWNINAGSPEYSSRSICKGKYSTIVLLKSSQLKI